MSNNLWKKMTLMVLIAISIITLSACTVEGDRYGSITNDAYLTVGDHQVTNRDLYDSFRLDAQSTLKEWFDKALVADQLAEVDRVIAAYTADYSSITADTNDFKVVEWLETAAITAIFGARDFATLESLSNNTKLISANAYVDSLIILNRGLNTAGIADTLITKLNTWLDTADEKSEDFQPFSLPKVVLDQYRLSAAQKLKARQLFDEEDFTDEDNDYYISDGDLINYYNNNSTGKYDVEAFIATFANANEANAALRDPSINIKSTSRGEWAIIPDPRYMDDTTLNSDDYIHVRQILNDLGITLQPFDISNPDKKRMSEADYKAYYDKYAISTSRTDGLKDVILTEEQVLAKFIALRELVENVTLTDEEKKVTYTYDDDAFTTNTALRSHIYSTLHVPEDADSNDKQYSPRIQTFGSYVYLVYKYADLKPEFEDDIVITIKNDEDEDEAIFNLDGLNPDTLETDDKSTERAAAALAAKDEAFAEVKDTKFTDAYVNSKVASLYEDKHPVIYDAKIKKFFDFNYSSTITLGSGNNRNQNVVAEFAGKTFLVDDLFAEMEKLRGISTAIDLAFEKLLKDEYSDDITTSDIKNFQEQYKTLINNFSSDQLASSGYPASLGRQDFLLLAFGATSNDQAINNMYVMPKLRELYYADLEAHYGAGIYEKFAELAGLQYDSFKSVTSSHLLVYIDKDLDGNPDDPNEVLEDAERSALEADIIRLIKIIYNRLGDYTTLDIGFNAIIAEYDAVNRVAPPLGTSDLNEGTSTFNAIWREFRQKGIYLKYESLSAITNTTNTPDKQTYDQAFVNRIMTLYASMKEYVNKDGQVPGDQGIFPFLDSYSAIEGDATGVNQALIGNVRSSFGWHFINITSLSYPSSAKSLQADDDAEDPLYISDFEDAFGNKLTAYNDKDQLSADQIQIYLKENASEYGVQSLPSTVSAAITAYFTPIKTKYDNANMQRELLVRYVLDQYNGTFAGTVQGDFANEIRAINRRQIDGYITLPGLDATADWNALWANWWTILESNVIVAPNLTYVIGDDEIDYLADVKVIDAFNKEIDVIVNVDSSDVKLTADSDIGIYNVVYSALVDGKTITKTVTVHVVTDDDSEVVDDEAPELLITDSADIVVNVGSSLDDLLTVIKTRVEASDNIDGNLTSQISINTKWVDLDTATVSGGYLVILTVTDAAGNQTVETLVVKVQ